MCSVVQTMAYEIAASHQDLPRMLEALLAQFLVLFGRTSKGATGGSRRQPSLVTRLKALLEAQFRYEHRVRAYAASLGVSADHLSAAVRKHEEGSVQSLIQRRILLEAKRLLQHTDLDVAGIAFSLGYQDPSHFTRAFKRGTGLSPSRFRNRTPEMY